MSSSALDLLNGTQLRASRTCLLVDISSSLLCKPRSGGGRWYRAGALAKTAFVFAAPSPLCQGAKSLSCSCNRVSLSSALQRLAVGPMAVAGPAAAPLPAAPSCHSSSPVSPGMFTRTCCVCHRGGSDTPAASPFQPEICTCLHKRADVHQQGGVCVLGGWCLRSASLFPQSHFLSEGWRGEIDTL